MHHYHRKQFFIAFAFIFIVVVVVGGIWLLVKPPKATCFDGIRNQGEKGIDCGGPCGLCPEDIRKPLEILLEDFIPTIDDNYDLMAEIKNPNKDWGIESVGYRFNLYDRNEELIGFKEGSIYVLPQETKYIIDQKFYSTAIPRRVELELKEINWRRLKDFDDLELRIRNENHQLIEEKFHQVSGVVENKSNFDLAKIEVVGLIFGQDDKIIAVGRTEMTSVLVEESRYFEINWPYETDRQISSFELKAHTNAFLDENFMKKHATPEKFKEY